jgi:hypothetical protein
MYTNLRRIALLLATSTGIITATTLTAHAGLALNHCEPGLTANHCGPRLPH